MWPATGSYWHIPWLHYLNTGLCPIAQLRSAIDFSVTVWVECCRTECHSRWLIFGHLRQTATAGHCNGVLHVHDGPRTGGGFDHLWLCILKVMAVDLLGCIDYCWCRVASHLYASRGLCTSSGAMTAAPCGAIVFYKARYNAGVCQTVRDDCAGADPAVHLAIFGFGLCSPLPIFPGLSCYFPG